MNIREKVSELLKESIKNKDLKKANTLRLIISSIKDKDIIAKTKNKYSGINDEEIIKLLHSMIKQRRASIEMYLKGNRNDLVEVEKNEIQIISSFLPVQLTEKEINDIVIKAILKTNAKTIKDIGKVISLLKQNYSGLIDFAIASKIIKDKLN